MKIFITFIFSFLIALLSSQVYSQQLIPFQARLTDGAGAVVADGVYAVNFNVYDAATAGTALWTETHSTVSVVGGVVNVILGSITPLNDPNNDGNLADAVTFFATSGDRFIGITIGTGQEMVPRHQLIPSFHAVSADDAATLGGNLPSFYTPQTQHNSDLQGLSNQFTGAIIAFVGNCPAGWLLADGASGTPDLRGRFLRGEPTGNAGSLNFGGNDDATVVSHEHTIDPPDTTTTTNGNHTHSGDIIGSYATISNSWDNQPFKEVRSIGTIGYAGDHNHTVNIAPFASAATGSSATNANIPKYYEVIYCVKT